MGDNPGQLPPLPLRLVVRTPLGLRLGRRGFPRPSGPVAEDLEQRLLVPPSLGSQDVVVGGELLFEIY